MRFQTTIEVDAVFFDGTNADEVVALIQKHCPGRTLELREKDDLFAVIDAKRNACHVRFAKDRWIYRNVFGEYPDWLVDRDDHFRDEWTPVEAVASSG